ncbi:alpha/beta hydrolase [Aestuariimicrobium soli]|uniref:alpha/beta hydrolase n=1 Tax=Aestuariimicrobium soli TaxID=2035834 RepID=UPI003EBEA8A1
MTGLVTETFDFDGGRRVTVHVPDGTPEAVVYAGDGQLIAPWGADLSSVDAPPTLVVGVHRLDTPGTSGDPESDDPELRRLAEYSPGFAPATFAAHENFLLSEVRSWVRARFGVDPPRARTAICGVSAGGELSLALGLRHPDLFGHVFSASPGGGFRPSDEWPSPLPGAYLVAGRQEPFFLDNASRWADALRAAGAEVVFEEREGDHGDPFWRAEFPRMVAWAFGR